MYSFEMDLGIAIEFYRRAKEANANTEEERTAILFDMAEEGLIKRVMQTQRTKEQYIKDLSKNFEVLDLTVPKFDPNVTIDAVWCKDSETGEDVLLDRKTNKIISRGLHD